MLRPLLFSALVLWTLVACGTASGTPVTLHMAAAANDRRSITALLSQGADIEARDRSGATPLLVATRRNNVAAALALIAAGADVNAKDVTSDSAYLYAGARGYLQILEATLAHGADLGSVNRFGGTALIPAAERGHVDTVRRLIAAGVDVYHVNRLGWTALLEAVLLGDGGVAHQQIVQALLEAGADPNLADAEGVTALHHAERRGQTEVAALLKARGAR